MAWRFVGATAQLAIAVEPRVQPLDRPAPADLDPCWDALDRDLVVEAEDLQQGAGLARES
jgi:hypothetical protein